MIRAPKIAWLSEKTVMPHEPGAAATPRDLVAELLDDPRHGGDEERAEDRAERGPDAARRRSWRCTGATRTGRSRPGATNC